MFEPFQNFLKNAAKRKGISNEVEAAHICHSFRSLIPSLFEGKQSVEENIEPAYFKNEVLVIDVAHPAWAQEVIMRKTKIIEEMNAKLGKQIIKNLRTQLKNY